MKKRLLFVLMLAICGLGTTTAQTENTFEGEITSRVHNVMRFKSQTFTKNIIAKMIVKSVLKKHIDNSPVNYTGTYDATTIAKGNKTKVISSYNNSVMITAKEDGKMKMTMYFPYIKKGYFTIKNLEEAKQQSEKMQTGAPEKTGETINVLGHTCDVYKIKYELATDTLDTKSELNLHNEFAMCDDSDLPLADQEYVKGVKGIPLKYTNNTVSHTSNKMASIDFVMSLASITTSITPKPVADSEFDIPSDIKIYEMEKDPKLATKLMEENRKYMEKKGLWKEENPDESKIYDNLSEEWDY